MPNGLMVGYQPGMGPNAPPMADNKLAQTSWTSLVIEDLLGPPPFWPPRADDTRTIGEMLKRILPCPKFPKDFRSESYRAWKLTFIKWILKMRQLAVSEYLLDSAFQEALKGGEGGVHNHILLVGPRILMWGGRPRGGLGPDDPGCLSGVVWYVEDVLDPLHLRRKHVYGKPAREAYLKYTRRPGQTTAQVISEFESLYSFAQLLAGFYQDDATRVDQLWKALALKESEEEKIKIEVRGDETAYEQICQIAKDIYPRDNEAEAKGMAALMPVAFADGGGGDGLTKPDPPTVVIVEPPQLTLASYPHGTCDHG